MVRCRWLMFTWVGLQRGLLAQLAARLRERQAGGIGEMDEVDEGEGAAIVVDDSCAVGSLNSVSWMLYIMD